MIALGNGFHDLLGFRGVQRHGGIELALGSARHVAIKVATAFPAELQLPGSSHLKAAFARFVGLHLRHKSSARLE